MATQDFTTYTEVDPNSRLTQTSTKATATNIKRDETAYVYYDFGAGYWSGDLEFIFECNASTASGGLGVCGLLALVNTLGILGTWRADLPMIGCWFYGEVGGNQIGLEENTASSGPFSDLSVALTSGTTYYPRFERDESVGTYGTIYLYIYSDSGRTTLVDTLSVTLHVAKYDFRYLETNFTLNTGSTQVMTAYIENLDLQVATPAGGRLIGNMHGGPLNYGRLVA